MKYYKGATIVSAMGKTRLKCDLCGSECLSLITREDKIKVCISCYCKDEEAEELEESANGK